MINNIAFWSEENNSAINAPIEMKKTILHRTSIQFLHLSLIAATVMISSLWLGSCAGQRPPEGGPLDFQPPTLVSVYPAPNSVHFNDNRLALEFSEYVDRRSVEESIFISPFPGEIEYDWSGKEVELQFLDPLKPATTYVVTIGTDVVDVNNHNRMAESFSFAFSTGTAIDRGVIEGRVVDDVPEGTMVFAYRLDFVHPDTLDPRKSRPDYITQTGKTGAYSLPYIALGSYRLFAIRDEYRNLLYDPEVDAAGTAPVDVVLTASDTLRSNILFQLAKEDTTPPRLLSVSVPDGRHIGLTFNEPLDSIGLTAKSFSVSDTNSQQPKTISSIIHNSSSLSTVSLISDLLKKDSVYRITVSEARDQNKLGISPLACSKIFSGTGVADTIPPRLVATTLADSSHRFSLEGTFRFEFDDAVIQDSLPRALLLLSADSTNIPFSIRWNGSAEFEMIPATLLKSDTRYTIALRLGSLYDRFGNRDRDSTLLFSFRTIDLDMLSSIQGNIHDANGTPNSTYCIVARNILNTKADPVSIKTKNNEQWILRHLSEGQYTLLAFEDRNDDGKYSAGIPFPYAVSERFAMYQDTVKVRARWPVEGVTIRLK